MNDANLLKKLVKRRELLDFSQDYMGVKLNMSQPAYSNIENGKTRLTCALVQMIKTIEGFEDFDKEETEQKVNSLSDTLTGLGWRWGTRAFYITLSIFGLLQLNLASIFADDLARGYSGGAEPDGYFTAISTFIFFILFAFVTYMVFRLAKWWMIRRNKAQ